MKRAVLIVGVITLMLTGCSAPAAKAPQPLAPVPQAIATSSTPTATFASIPSLQLVPVSSFANRQAIKPGTVVSAGTFEPLLAGSHIQSVRWATGGSATSTETVLVLKFDSAGTDVLARWTTDNVEEGLAVVLGDRVIAAPKVMGPLTTGSLSVGGPEVLAMRSAIDSATVPAK